MSAASIVDMRKTQLEKLILAKHTLAINKRKDRDIWYTRDPRDASRKISATTKDGLYQKLFAIYYHTEFLTIEELFSIWLEWHAKRKGIVSRSVVRYDQQFKKFILPSDISKMKIRDIQGSDLEAFFASQASTISRHDLTNVKGILNGIYDYAVAHDIVTTNLARQYNTRSIKTKAENLKEYEVFTDIDRQKILNHLQDSDNPYDMAICFMFCLLCRIGEVRALHWEDINWENNTILIHSQIVLRKGDDEKMHAIEVSHTKTGHDAGVRSMHLSQRALRILEKAKELSGGHGYIFTSTSSGHPLYDRTFNKHLKKTCLELNIQPRSSHKIRFWATSSMAANGADISMLIANGGWSDKSTALHYLRRVEVEQKTNQIWDKSFN